MTQPKFKIEPFEFVIIGVAVLLVALAVMMSGCGTPATIARKVVTGIDAADGAAARIARQWVKQCGADAAKLRDAGRLQEADTKYISCEQTADKLIQAVVGIEDGAQAASEAIDAGEALQQKEYGAVLAPLFALAKSLAKVFADAGLKLPAIPGL